MSVPTTARRSLGTRAQILREEGGIGQQNFPLHYCKRQRTNKKTGIFRSAL